MTQNIGEAASSAQDGDAGAPGSEVEVTPEMIEAGVLAFLEYDSRYESQADVVQEIFERMWAAKGATSGGSRDPVKTAQALGE